eukprot:CAMPEP_0115858012 /NCGR_PEP_ID=MMETSP0287-20121206/15875_1 /TAXON_ID=412157 /ORGANISM="Chrysochromulina rotalis, Strain UIO044" /LENGTH=92 /DNA_ID=CAMNT_0003312257 /DNA_START=595 /DNA_END=873 /DNA_ORIENTATION=+
MELLNEDGAHAREVPGRADNVFVLPVVEYLFHGFEQNRMAGRRGENALVNPLPLAFTSLAAHALAAVEGTENGEQGRLWRGWVLAGRINLED